ncbi:hypothetical protein A6R68_17490, partial [Neotoma lepida]
MSWIEPQVTDDICRNMVSSFRVSELQVLLGFAGRNKSGRKHDLLMRALHLLKSGCSPAVQIKIRELYRRRYPRTLEGLSDLSTIKSSVFSLDGSSSPLEPDLAVPGIHSLPSTSITPHSPSSPVGSVLLQDTKPTFEMQQPSPPIPPVHPDVQLKNLPFYDVLDVLIKPTSLDYKHQKHNRKGSMVRDGCSKAGKDAGKAKTKAVSRSQRAG